MCRRASKADDDDEDDDLVTRLFERVFGKREESALTFGLSRVDAETNPELWPADLELITPQEGVDDKVYSRRTILESRVKAEGEYEIAYDGDAWYLRQLLRGTSLENRELITLYDSADDGFSAESFHRCVDGFGPAIVLASTTLGSVFGAYNPAGWVGYGDARDAISAFLFYFPNGDFTNAPVKLQKIGGPSFAVEDDPGTGPKFGVGSLECALRREDPKRVKSRLGSYYSRRPDQGRTLFTQGESEKAGELARLRVFGGTDCGLREIEDGQQPLFYR